MLFKFKLSPVKLKAAAGGSLHHALATLHSICRQLRARQRQQGKAIGEANGWTRQKQLLDYH
jgi:hypothetical protein